MKDRMEILREDRRALHKIPEIGFELSQTISYIEGRLASLHCEILHRAKASICAFFDAGSDSCIAFRADMDALPINENTGVSYASGNAGKMHACGHDGHTSMLLSLADIIDEKLDSLPNNILLIFQPAEETTGGAKLICESGIFKEHNVKAIFGFHLWPGLKTGEIRSKAGAVMAKTSEVHVSVTGKSAHVARAEEGRDALYAAVCFLHEAFAMAKEQEPLSQTRLLKFGCMQSGTVQNAISAYTKIGGTMRAYDLDFYELMRKKLIEIAGNTQERTGCKVELDISDGYPPVINDAKLYEDVIEYLGEDLPLPLEKPSLTGEDFSFYQHEVPGLFFFLGTGKDLPLHSDGFDFDEVSLLSGLRLYERLLFFKRR